MKTRAILMFVFALMIGLSIVVLAQMSNGQRLYVSPKVLDDYKITIEGEQKDMDNLIRLLSDAKAKVTQYEALQATDQDVSQQLEIELMNNIDLYQLSSGEVAAEGPGVEVFIDDGTRDLEAWESPNDILVHDADLLLIINELKAAGAEIISVNGQRIVDETSISCSGYTVRINGQFHARPFIIKAIGDGSRMSATLIGPGGYGTVLKDWGLVFKVTLSDHIIIPAYTENRFYQYMSLVTAE